MRPSNEGGALAPGRPSGNELLKVACNNPPKKGGAMSATLLGAPSLITPPHFVKELKAQSRMQQTPPEKGRTEGSGGAPAPPNEWQDGVD